MTIIDFHILLLINYLEVISKLGFSVEISRPRSARQEREAEDQPAGNTQVC